MISLLANQTKQGVNHRR